ncbi:MAG: transcription elongation factor GreA [Candidatus Omnitrophica bacterium]|jgi:transcription elongation factor GreA|nr:transcription elongation factor GreA [Candidatus Omnitrophota bacterium]
MERTYLTREGYEKLMQELEHLKIVKRKEFSAAVEHARLLGDLKENAEYDAAKEALAFNEKRIRELEGKLSTAEIIEENAVSTGAVCLGVKVKIVDLDSNEEVEYKMVGPDEADPVNGFISISSPVGRALLGHKENDVVDVNIPAGTLKYKVIKISN